MFLELSSDNPTDALKSLKDREGKALVDVLKADDHQAAADFIGAFMQA